MLKLVHVAISVGQNNRAGFIIRGSATWDVNGNSQTVNYETSDFNLDPTQSTKLQTLIDNLTSKVVALSNQTMGIDPNGIT